MDRTFVIFNIIEELGKSREQSVLRYQYEIYDPNILYVNPITAHCYIDHAGPMILVKCRKMKVNRSL